MRKILFFLIFFPALLSFSQELKENTDFRLAVRLYDDKLYDLALEQFKRFIELYPNTQLGIQSKYYLGLAQFQLKKYDEAKNTFQNFAVSYQQHPQAPEAWWKVAECFIAVENFSDAALTFERLKLFHPSSELAPIALLKSAEYFSKINDFENAQRVLKIILQEYGFTSVTAQARFLLGNIYIRLDFLDKAINEYKRIIDENSPPNLKCQSLISLGKLYFKMGKIELAISYLNQVINNNPKSMIVDSASLELGMLFEDMGDYFTAKKYYTSVADTVKSRFEIKKLGLIRLANLNIKMENFQEAIRNLNFFEDIYKDDILLPQIWFLIAETYRKSKDYRNSNEYYKKVIQSKEQSLNRKMSFLYNAINSENLRNYYESINYYNTFVDEYPSDQIIPEVLFKAGRIYLEGLKDYRKAISKFEMILTKYSFCQYTDDAQFYLGISYENNKEFDRAIYNYQEILSHFSNSEYYEKAKERIEYVNNFISQNSIEGFKKIGLLLQDIISDKPKGEIAYRLGWVYFNDLKDYKSALAQFDIALSSNINDSLKYESNYYKTISIYNIALTDHDTSNVTKYLNDFLLKYPKSPMRDQIVTHLFKANIGTKLPSEILKLTDEYLRKYNNYSMKDLFFIQLVKSNIELGAFNKVIDNCEILIMQYKNSNYLEDAIFYEGYAFFMLSQDSTAKRQFNIYLERYPLGRFIAQSLFYLAKINRNQKEFQKAIDQYDEIIKKFYYTEIVEQSQKEIANTYFEKGDFKSSYRLFLQFLKAIQSDPFEDENIQDEYIYKIALSYEKLNDLDNAKKYYQTYILKYKNGTYFNDAIFNLGLIYEKEGKKDLAVTIFKQINNASGDVKVSLRIADLFYNHEQYKEAQVKYLSILDSSKDEKIRKNCKAKVILIDYKTNNLVEALRLQKLFEDEYNNIDNYLAEFEYERAYYYYRKKDYELAKKIFLDVVDEYEKTEFAAWSMYWIGKLEESISQNDEAIKVFDWIVRNFPISKAAARSNLSLGNIYFRNEKFDFAVKYYKTIIDKSLEESQIYSSALNNLIECYNKLSLYDAAIEYCRKFIDLFPEDESVSEKKLKIGILYKQLKYYDQAIIHFQSLLDYVDQNIETEIRYYIGECYYSKTEYQQALLEFLKIPYLITKLTKIDWIPPAYYMAGQCYEKLNKFEQAITMYQQIIDKPGIDSTFKAQAAKEIDRVKTLLLSNKK